MKNSPSFIKGNSSSVLIYFKVFAKLNNAIQRGRWDDNGGRIAPEIPPPTALGLKLAC
jgi:hypothetical protein